MGYGLGYIAKVDFLVEISSKGLTKSLRNIMQKKCGRKWYKGIWASL